MVVGMIRCVVICVLVGNSVFSIVLWLIVRFIVLCMCWLFVGVICVLICSEVVFEFG